MPRLRIQQLAVLSTLLCLTPSFAQPPRSEPRPRLSAETPAFRTRTASSLAASQLVPLDGLNPTLRDKVRRIINQPTLVTNAAAEDVTGSPKTYEWLLDHPDRAALAWQRLGVDCAPITDRGNGRFGWGDDSGSDLVWHTIANGPTGRVWYAEGQVRPGQLLPLIPVRAVVVLRHTYNESDPKSPRIRHQVDVFAHADSRAANLVARLFGQATDRMAEQGAEQLLVFFGTLSRHLSEHPERAEKLLAPVRQASTRGTGSDPVERPIRP